MFTPVLLPSKSCGPPIASKMDMKQLLIIMILFFGLYSCGKNAGDSGGVPKTTVAPELPEEETERPIPRTITRTFKCYLVKSEEQYGLKSLIRKTQTALTYSECGDSTGVCRSGVFLAYQNTDSQKCLTRQDHPEDFQICLSQNAPTRDSSKGRLIKAEFAELDTVTELWCEEEIKMLF